MVTLTAISSGKSRPWRWWRLQFGLRSLFALTLVASLLLGAWRWYEQTYLRQHAALEAFESWWRTEVETEPGGPAWLRPLFKREVFQDVTRLTIGASGMRNEELAPIAHFPRLRELTLDDAAITDDGLAHLVNLTELEALSLKNTHISSLSLTHLRGLKNLKRLELSNTQIDGAGLAQLMGLKKLEVLELDGLRIEDEHLASLAGLDALKNLHFNGTPIRGPGLKSLGPLSKLAKLRVSGEQLRDVDIDGFVALEELIMSAPESAFGRYRVANCPRLAKLSIKGQYEFLDLRNLPRLTSFANIDGVTAIRWHVVARNKQVPDLADLKKATVRLENLSGLREFSLHSDGCLSLNVQQTPALKTAHVIASAMQDARFDGVPRLEELALAMKASSDDFRLPYDQLGSLRRLELSCGKTARLSLPQQGTLRELEELQLLLASFDNADLAPLETLPRLRRLTVNSASLTDDKLTHLHFLPTVQSVSLYSHRPSVQALQRLSQSLPDNCVLTRTPYIPPICGVGVPKDDVFQGGQRVIENLSSY